MGNRIAGVIGIGLLVAGGCDRPQPVPSPTPPASTQAQLTTLPASRPVERPVSIITITQPDGSDKSIAFPASKLVLKEIDGKVHASLFSIDPPEALRDDYTGNTFFLEMTFDAPMADLDGAEFVYQNSQNDKPDDDTGIFLAGRKQILQPLEAAVRLQQVEGEWVATLAGSFQLFEAQTPDRVSLTVALRTRLTPEVVIKKST